jgi:hypothetical protein
VVIAVRRVDKTREDLNKPPAPVEPGMPVEALGPTVGQNLIFALNDLTNAQNNLMSVVLNYYETRMLLYRNLGIMELDDCGMWIERPIEDSEYLSEAECPLPPGVPGEWFDEAGVDPREAGPAEFESDGELLEGAEPIRQVRANAARGHFADLIPNMALPAETPGDEPAGLESATQEPTRRMAAKEPSPGAPLMWTVRQASHEEPEQGSQRANQTIVVDESGVPTRGTLISIDESLPAPAEETGHRSARGALQLRR